MITGLYPDKKAIAILMVVMAFFLTGCYKKIPSQEDDIGKTADIGLSRAEKYREKGDLDKALNEYGTWLKTPRKGEKTAYVLSRMAEIYSMKGQYERALGLYEKIAAEYPNYSMISNVRYNIAYHLYMLHDYRRSVQESLKTINECPKTPLKGDIALLLAESYMALGENSRAFKWWLKAKNKFYGDPLKEAKLDIILQELITTLDLEHLEDVDQYAYDNTHLPEIYYKMASLFLKRDELNKAYWAARSLIRSSPDASWLSLGYQILDKIEKRVGTRSTTVGCLLPLTGPFAIYGEEALNGIELGLGPPCNSQDNIHIELLIKDTAGDPQQTEKALEELVNEKKVIAVIGPLSSRTCEAAAKKAQSMGVPLIALSQKEGIEKEREMVFRNFITPSQEITTLLNAVMGKKGVRRFAILYPENSYGRFFMNRFWDKLENMGGVVTAVESYDPESTDFADQIKKMTGTFYPRPASVEKEFEQTDLTDPGYDEREKIKEGPEDKQDEPEPIIDFDAIFIPDGFQTVAMIAPQLVYHDVRDVQLIGTSMWQSDKLIKLAKNYVQGAIFPSAFFGKSGAPGVQNFIKSYKENFGTDPGILAAAGYDTVMLLRHLMATCDIITRNDLRQALSECTGFNGVSGELCPEYGKGLERTPLLLTISGNNMVLFR